MLINLIELLQLIIYFRSHCGEQLIVTLTILFSIGEFRLYYFEFIVKTGKVVLPHWEGTTPGYTEEIDDTNVETVFQDCETATLKEISVYSVPLEAPFSSSNPWPAIKCVFQKQFSVFDYHVVVVLQTEDGRYFAVEKQRDGVYVTRRENLDSVLFYFNGAKRGNPISKLIKAQSTSSLGDIVRHLKTILPTNCYSVLTKNCQHFAKDIFDEFNADNAKWDFVLFTDIRLLFSRGGFLLFVLLQFVSHIYDLYLLNTYTETQYAVYIVIIVSLLLLFTTDDKYIIIMGLPYFMLLFSLLYEGILYTPLGAIRKHGAQYIKMWRSGSWIYKCCLPLCYGMVYVYTIYVILVLILLFTLRDLLKHLSTRVPALSPLLAIVTWLYDKAFNVPYTVQIITSYIVTGIYFSLQD